MTFCFVKLYTNEQAANHDYIEWARLDITVKLPSSHYIFSGFSYMIGPAAVLWKLQHYYSLDLLFIQYLLLMLRTIFCSRKELKTFNCHVNHKHMFIFDRHMHIGVRHFPPYYVLLITVSYNIICMYIYTHVIYMLFITTVINICRHIYISTKNIASHHPDHFLWVDTYLFDWRL